MSEEIKGSMKLEELHKEIIKALEPTLQFIVSGE